MDTQWLSIEAAAAQLGISTQAVRRAAQTTLATYALSRRQGRNWQVSEHAVNTRASTGSWLGEHGGATIPGHVAERIAELESRLEVAELRASLNLADAHAAELAIRDTRIAALTAQVQELRQEVRSLLQARLSALDEG